MQSGLGPRRTRRAHGGQGERPRSAALRSAPAAISAARALPKWAARSASRSSCTGQTVAERSRVAQTAGNHEPGDRIPQLCRRRRLDRRLLHRRVRASAAVPSSSQALPPPPIEYPPGQRPSSRSLPHPPGPPCAAARSVTGPLPPAAPGAAVPATGPPPPSAASPPGLRAGARYSARPACRPPSRAHRCAPTHGRSSLRRAACVFPRVPSPSPVPFPSIAIQSPHHGVLIFH